jgi:hypothetical protein
MKDSSALQIGNDRHVLMTFPDTELINAEERTLCRGMVR